MRTCSTSETCGVAGAGAMGMADAAGDATNAPSRVAATRPILSFMMSFSPLTQYRDIEVCSDQIVAGAKCNADEQVFSQPAAGLTFSSARLSQVRALDQCCPCVALRGKSPPSLIPRNPTVQLRP